MTFESGNQGAIASAVTWLQTLIAGNLATIVAILAVAWVGFLMLHGRIDLRRAFQVVLGCFILFGAPIIARGILAGLDQSSMATRESAEVIPVQAIAAPAAQSAFDPYAGAAVPSRR